MRKTWRFKWLWVIGAVLLLLFGVIMFLMHKPVPEQIVYGMSFNTFYAEDLGLDWKETYDAILDDLQVKHLRLAAHWPMVEPNKDIYNFSELDYQLQKAESAGADVILAVGRRLPRWPECHVPDWAEDLTWEEQKEHILDYMNVVVNRYKDHDSIIYWQVENEPFLEIFAYEHCGKTDEAFLAEEVAFVKNLDPSRPILVTDSGNIGSWREAFRYGDIFGTSVYIHFWNPELGQFRTIIPPWFYPIKENVMKLIYGDRETLLIELSAEPWLLEPITDVPIETQYSRMDITKLEDILSYAKRTRYEKQYLWGAEWWYWLNERGHPEMWDRGKQLFVK